MRHAQACRARATQNQASDSTLCWGMGSGACFSSKHPHGTSTLGQALVQCWGHQHEAVSVPPPRTTRKGAGSYRHRGAENVQEKAWKTCTQDLIMEEGVCLPSVAALEGEGKAPPLLLHLGLFQQPVQGGLGWNQMTEGGVTGTRNRGPCG